MSDSTDKRFQSLRRRAEQALQSRDQPLAADAADDVRELLHELSVHQIELQMQNEDLLAARNELEHSRDKLQRLYDFAPVGYLTIDTRAVVISANLTFAAMVGHDRQALIGKPLAGVLVSEYQTAFYQMFVRRQSGECVLRMQRADGGGFWALARVEPEGGTDRPEYWVIVTDVTAQHEAEQALRRGRDELEQRVEQRTAELRRLTGELNLVEQRERRRLALVLHDQVQQLLVGAKLGLEMLRPRAGEDLRPSVERITAIIVECIDASRTLTTELSPPVLHEAGLDAGLRWLARWMHDRHGLSVAVTADPDAGGESDEVRALLFQSVREGLFNVVKHAGVKEATVELTRKDGDRLRIVIVDRGRGFDPAAPPPRAASSSSGLGLVAIRERLRMIGGDTEIDSAPDRGTRLVLVAPIDGVTPPPLNKPTASAPPPTAHRIPAAMRPGPNTGRRIRVLLVDDHVVVRQGLSALIAAEDDIEVIDEASTGREAVDKAHILRPDVVLMDVTMPDLGGIEATRMIHAELPEIRIVGLSMFDEADRAAAMLDAGAAEYVCKHDRAESLLDAIRRRDPA